MADSDEELSVRQLYREQQPLPHAAHRPKAQAAGKSAAAAAVDAGTAAAQPGRQAGKRKHRKADGGTAEAARPAREAAQAATDSVGDGDAPVSEASDQASAQLQECKCVRCSWHNDGGAWEAQPVVILPALAGRAEAAAEVSRPQQWPVARSRWDPVAVASLNIS